MSLARALVIAALGAAVACNALLDNEAKSLTPFPFSDDDAGDARSPTDPPDLVVGPQTELPPSCTDACPTDGVKRCSTASSAGVEICSKAADGCLAWKQDADCAADFSCDTTKNDGTCKAGCVNDAGCDAGKVGTKRCVLPTGPNGTAEQTCSAVGACFQWQTTRSNIPQQCLISGNYCVFDDRKNCIESAAGACTQHVSQANPCAQGSVCQLAGQCVQAPMCGTGLTCAGTRITGATACNQTLPPTKPVIYCCPSGKTISGGKCV